MFAAHVFGMVGFFYSDLGDSHAYIEYDIYIYFNVCVFVVCGANVSGLGKRQFRRALETARARLRPILQRLPSRRLP